MDYIKRIYDGKIYKCTNKINGKIYIGQTIDFNVRYSLHIRNAFNPNSPEYNNYFHRAINKYGIENFEWKIIWNDKFEVLKNTPTVLDEMEIFFIEENKSYYKNGFGYNMTRGGSSSGIGIDNPTYDNTLYTFYHDTGIVEENITQYELRIKYNLPASCTSKLCSKKSTRKRALGWSLINNYIPDNILKDKFNFYHRDGIIEECVTCQYMKEKYNISNGSIKDLRYGKTKSAKGWFLDKDLIGTRTLYTFININNELESNITREYMVKKYNFTKREMDKLCNHSYYVNGWKLIRNKPKSII